jgi:hypothetical protein
MINMKTATRKVVNNHKHKKCKTRITKIMITKKVGTGKVDNRYNEERREGRRRST